MSYKFLKSKNSRFISRLKKYSNIELFSRRENELLQKINSNKVLPIKTNKNKNIENNDPNNNLSDFALKTISSFKSSFDFLTTQFESFSQKNNKNKTKNKFEIYPYNRTLTEFNTNKKMNGMKKNKVFSTNDIRNHNNKIYNYYMNNLNNIHFNTISNSNSNNNILFMKEKESKIELLKELQIKHNKKEKKINKKIISLMNSKQKKFNVKKKSINDLINQTCYLKLYKYTLKNKKEMALRIQENYQNENEYFDDKVNYLKIGMNLYNIRLGNKISEYVKYILYYRDQEKKRCDILENNKNKYKNEIMILQNKIRKEELEKENILRWIYFQIKMKEKKLILPEYYKKIIETNVKRINTRRKTISINMNNIKMVLETKKFHHLYPSSDNSKDRSSKHLIQIKEYNLSNIIEEDNNSKNLNISRKKYGMNCLSKSKINNKSKDLKDNFSVNKTENNNIINFQDTQVNEILEKMYSKLNEGEIDGYEINRITQYKLFLIYETPEELLDRLTELENENLMLISQYNSLQKSLNELKRKYSKILYEKKENNINLINRIKLKEYELNERIKRNDFLKNQVSDMKTGKFFSKRNNINNFLNLFKNKYKFRKNKNTSSSSYIGNEVYLRILNIFKIFHKNDVVIQKGKNKKVNYKEEIIHMLSLIERQVDIIKNKFKVYNNPEYENYEMMKKIKNEIEKRHKIENGELLRFKEEEKYLNFQKEIEKKMNRIIFLQKRKTDMDYDLNSMGINCRRKNSKREDNKGEPVFEDFMFENNDFINFEK